MRLDIRDLDQDGAHFEGPLALPNLPLFGDEQVVVRQATLAGTAVPGSFGADLRARLDARIELTCVRCLEPYETELSVRFELILVPGEREPDAAPDGPSESEPDPALFYPVPDGIADLASVAREQIYLNLPLKPVCAETCRGLCPTCGANRNRLECGCQNEAVDPRLAPLLEFRKRLPNS